MQLYNCNNIMQLYNCFVEGAMRIVSSSLFSFADVLSAFCVWNGHLIVTNEIILF